MRSSMMRVAVVILAVLPASGCWMLLQATQNSILSSYKSYAGVHRPRSEIAVLLSSEAQGAQVVSLDGDKSQELYGALVVELLPGPHHLCVAMYKMTASSRGCVDFDFVAEAGHTYDLYAVEHTHQQKWHPAIWDISSELACAERARAAEQATALLGNARKEAAAAGTTFDPTTVASPAPGCPAGTGSLPGSGEERQANITLPEGRSVTLTYDFERYRPYVRADGSDGTTYHVKLAIPSGEVERVLGESVDVGGIGHYEEAFRPLGSQLAYVDNNDGTVRIYEEQAAGDYVLREPSASPPAIE